MTGIDATCEEEARLAAVETGCTEEVLCRAVAVAVAPGSVQTGLTCLQTLQGIVHHLIRLACLTVHIHQELCPFVNEPLVTVGSAEIVLGLVAYLVCLAVGRMNHHTIGGSYHGLCPSVLIPVVGDDVLLVVLEIGHVRSEIDPPEPLAIQFIHLYDKVLTFIAGLPVAGISPALVIELDQDFQFPVTVHIGTTGIIGHIGRLQIAVVGRNLQPMLRPHACLLLSFSPISRLLPPDYRFHCILTRCRSGGIDIVRHRERLLVHLHAIAIEIIGHVIVFLGQYAPGAEHAAISLNGHESTVQCIRHPLRHSRRNGHTDQHY